MAWLGFRAWGLGSGFRINVGVSTTHFRVNIMARIRVMIDTVLLLVHYGDALGSHPLYSTMILFLLGSNAINRWFRRHCNGSLLWYRVTSGGYACEIMQLIYLYNKVVLAREISD